MNKVDSDDQRAQAREPSRLLWPSVAGVVAAWLWYIADRLGYDAVRDTAFAAMMDRVAWVVFWPVHWLWRRLEAGGTVPLGDYAWDFVVYHVLQGLWLTIGGALLGLLVVCFWRALR